MRIKSFVQNCLLIIVLTLISHFSWMAPATASIPLDDQLQATKSCEAFQSFRKRTNPGSIRLTADRIYPVVAKNKAQATHYQLKIAGAKPPQRWVTIDCGKLRGSSPPVKPITPTPAPPTPAQNPTNLLAISWQPAFCETRESKPECQTQTVDRFDASHFTLHGLWPEPIYCNVNQRIKQLDQAKQWQQLPDIELSQSLRNELQVKMPGVASGLHLHEWYKHGTCYSATPEEYYRESLALLDQVNASTVRDLFVDNIDRKISSRDIRDQFNTEFTNAAGRKVSIKCANDPRPQNRRMIQELRLNFKGAIEPNTQMATLFKHGQSVTANCAGGEVDRAGFN